MLTAPLLALALAGAPYVPPPASQVPGYFNRPITAQDLAGKSLRELAILRNTIYARWGWDRFRKSWLRDHFHAQPWFKPNPDFRYGEVSALDRQNAHAIAEKEAGFTGTQLRAMEFGIFAAHHVTVGVVPRWRLPDGKVVAQCLPPPHAQRLSADVGSDCPFQGSYAPDPTSTVATLPADARVELGLIQRSLGDFALDGEDHLADPHALDKLLKLDDLRQLSGRDLRILRNTIYARRGRPFRSPVLRAYFAGKGWYHPDPAYTDARLTPIDRRNVAMIRTVEDELGGPITDSDQTRSLMDPTFDGA